MYGSRHPFEGCLLLKPARKAKQQQQRNPERLPLKREGEAPTPPEKGGSGREAPFRWHLTAEAGTLAKRQQQRRAERLPPRGKRRGVDLTKGETSPMVRGQDMIRGQDSRTGYIGGPTRSRTLTTKSSESLHVVFVRFFHCAHGTG